MKRYKYQALLTMQDGDDLDPELSTDPRRMVLRGRNEESGRIQLFNALVSCDDDTPIRPGSQRVLATVRVAGDDVPDYMPIGGHFQLLLGHEVGEGIITRRLFV